MYKNGIDILNIEINEFNENLGQVKITRKIKKCSSCGHKFSLVCFKKQEEEQEEEQVKGEIKCSICDIDREIPSGSIINFPTNIKIKKRLSLKESTLKKNEENTQLECPICYENSENPRFLPCFHKFCPECILKMEKESLNGKIKCPLSRKEHVITIDRQNIQKSPPFIISNESLINPRIQSNNINRTIPPVFSTNRRVITNNECNCQMITVYFSHY
jgi:hypothetical protein